MNNRLFAYGTLQAAEVIGALIGRSITGVAANIHGYGCYRVAQADYPGIVTETDGRVKGKLYQGLNKADFVKLDQFEGELYSRVIIPVETDSGQSLRAWAYVIRKNWQHRLTSEPWYYDDHVEKFMARFRRYNIV